MKGAYLVLSSKFDSSVDRANIKEGKSWIIGVKDLEDACNVAKELLEDGFDEVTLCGGFREDGARAIINATENKMCVAYAVHLPEQDDMFLKMFGRI